MKSQRDGIALCVLSACCFGAMAIFAKEAYADGVDVLTLLSARAVLAAAAFWAIVAVRGTRMPSRPVVLAGLALGAAGYAGQAVLFFGALTRIDASLASLLSYIYPLLVFLGAVALGREQVSPRRTAALGLACAGTMLVLLGGAVGAVDRAGVAMAVGAAFVYATYILVADRLVGAIDGFMVGALVCTGAAASMLGAGLVSGELHAGFGVAGWGWICALALGSTVLGLTALYAGMRRVGPATASIVSTAEPAVTVTLAGAIYGESLHGGQLAGGALVLAAVVLLQLRPGSVARDEPAPVATAAAPARALAYEPA